MTSPAADETTPPAPVDELSYEQARDELVALVARIESGQVPLEESMALWERGEELAAHCQGKLDAAQETLDRATRRGEDAGEPAEGDSAATLEQDPVTGESDQVTATDATPAEPED